jgi:hypothetical protein
MTNRREISPAKILKGRGAGRCAAVIGSYAAVTGNWVMGDWGTETGIGIQDSGR